MSDTNIGYWEKVLKNPTPAYKELIDTEYAYLLEKIPVNSKVLDIGCGDGRNMRTALNMTNHVFGIDNDDVAIGDARQNFSDVNSVGIQKAEATKLPFEDKTFDVVIFFDILQNLDSNKLQVLMEAKRVLKDDGIILLCTYSEEGFEERSKMYNIIHVPIENIEKTKFIFKKSVGAYLSEQFSSDDIKNLADKSMLTVNDLRKIGKLAYICTLNKIGM